MFNVNEYVVYGLTGVCRITDIRNDEFTGDNEIQYYILTPVDSDNMTIMVPVNTPNIAMRAISTKDDVLSLIESMPEMESAWNNDERARNADFKAALKSGKNEEWARIVKTLYLEKERRAVIGKKLTKTDEEIFNTAENKLNQEFALALNISPGEVISFILERIS